MSGEIISSDGVGHHSVASRLVKRLDAWHSFSVQLVS
jgi:hypothetical protein